MKRTALAAVCILGMSFCNSTASYGGEKGNDNVTKTYEVEDFNGIHTSGSFRIYYTQGTRGVSVSAPAEDLENLTVEVREGTLHLGMKKKNIRIKEWKKITANISSPALNRVHISGAGDFEAADGITTDNFDVKVSGAGDIVIDKFKAKEANFQVSGAGEIDITDLDCDSINTKVSGAGDICVSGKANTANFEVSGAGDINIKNLNCPEIGTSISGSGKIRQ